MGLRAARAVYSRGDAMVEEKFSDANIRKCVWVCVCVCVSMCRRLSDVFGGVREGVCCSYEIGRRVSSALASGLQTGLLPLETCEGLLIGRGQQAAREQVRVA